MIVYILLSKQSDKPIEVVKVYESEVKAQEMLTTLAKFVDGTKFRIIQSEFEFSQVRRAKVVTVSKDEIAYSVEFAKFWSAYPRKTAKGEAYQAWLKANPPLDAVLKSLDWQRGCEDWTKGGGQFIPHPSTYLHQRRWEDERTTTTPVLTVIKHNCEYEGCDRPSNLMTERGRRCVNHISK